ncbi:MAG: hypothetical protein FWE14_07655 [Lachnospiraceae bacterium]|nr:hypothetical protein [Lachnospiraceae bacterium]
MNITPQQAKVLLLEEHNFSQLGFSMMLTRLKSVFAEDPSQEVLENSTQEINAFLDKFKGVMKDDLMIILNL